MISNGRRCGEVRHEIPEQRWMNEDYLTLWIRRVIHNHCRCGFFFRICVTSPHTNASRAYTVLSRQPKVRILIHVGIHFLEKKVFGQSEIGCLTQAKFCAPPSHKKSSVCRKSPSHFLHANTPILKVFQQNKVDDRKYKKKLHHSGIFL